MTDKNNIQKSIIEQLGLAALAPEKKEEIALKVTEAILKRIYVDTVERLSEADQEVYVKLMESSASEAEMEEFLLEKIPDYDELVKKAADGLIAEIVK
jgi:hypothetical protein